MPLDVGPCEAYFPRFFYDSLDASCKEFGYGGCGGNKNNFETKEDCVNSCVGRKFDCFDYHVKSKRIIKQISNDDRILQLWLPEFFFSKFKAGT